MDANRFKNFKSVCRLIEAIGEEWGTLGTWERSVTRVASLDEADNECLAFCEKLNADMINNSKAGIIICPSETEFLDVDYKGKTLIQVENPRRAFVKLIKAYFMPQDNNAPVQLGKNVVIGEGTVIGGAGFGYYGGDSDELLLFPHIGGVIIGDDVGIGSNACIERGTLGDTIIGKGTKIDNLVSVGHNAKIGEHCAIGALTDIAGSSTIDDYTWISPLVCVRDWVNIGKRVIVGMGAVVTKDVPDDAIVTGVPAKEVGKNIPFRRIP